MRRSALPLLLLLALCVGCGSSRKGAHYGWLRKEGARTAAIAPTDRDRKQAPADVEADESTSADIMEDPADPPVTPRRKTTGHTARPPAIDALAARDTTRRKDGEPQDSSYYSLQHHPWNAKAIASLPIAVATVVVGIATQSIYLLLIGGAIAFALGLIASRQCRDRGDHGKGFAILAMVLGAAALFFSLMALITAA